MQTMSSDITPPITVGKTHDEATIRREFLQEQEAVEVARLLEWNRKRAREEVPIKFKLSVNPETGHSELRIDEINGRETNITDHLDLHASVMCAAFGTASHEYFLKQLNQTLKAQFVNEKNGTSVANATVEALIAMKPNDIVEGQLCSRLVTLTDQSNEYMRRATFPDQPLEAREKYINLATKLMRVYNETLEALNKHRRKGEQRVVVQHVTVNDGGRAVVASNFTQPGVGVQGGNEGGDHAKNQ
jgi:hypothetical protein